MCHPNANQSAMKCFHQILATKAELGRAWRLVQSTEIVTGAERPEASPAIKHSSNSIDLSRLQGLGHTKDLALQSALSMQTPVNSCAHTAGRVSGRSRN